MYAINFEVLALFFTIFLSWSPVEAACYYPSGRLAPNDTPCRDDTPNATCCGQGYACLTNNICQATGDELQKPGATEFVRGSCTDKQWRSSSCPLFCIQDGVDLTDGGNGIAKCGNTTGDLYFCIDRRSSTSASCEDKEAVLFFPGTPSAITTIGVSPSTTSSSSSVRSSTTTSWTSTSSAATSITAPARSTSASPGLSEVPQTSATHTPTDNPEKQAVASSNLGAIAGGAIGGTAAVILAGIGGWLLARKRRRDGGRDAVESGSGVASACAGDPTLGEPDANVKLYDALGSEWEYQAQRGPFELAQASAPRHRQPVELFAELPAGYR